MNIDLFIQKNFEDKGEQVISIQELKTSGNSSFLISTDKSEYILRLCGNGPRYRTYEEISSEVDLLNYLLENKIPVPKPIDFNKEFVISVENKNGILYKYVLGKNNPNPDNYHCFKIGEILGKIHKLTMGREYPGRKKWDLKTAKEKFEEIKNEITDNEILEKFSLILNELTFPDDLPKGILHEDFGKRHVFFIKEEVSGIIDWDRSYYGPLILDLGQAIRGWCMDNWEDVNTEKVYSLVRGYESQRKLNETERTFLLNVIKFAFIERAISYYINYLNNKNPEDKEFVLENIYLIKKCEEQLEFINRKLEENKI